MRRLLPACSYVHFILSVMCLPTVQLQRWCSLSEGFKFRVVYMAFLQKLQALEQIVAELKSRPTPVSFCYLSVCSDLIL